MLDKIQIIVLSIMAEFENACLNFESFGSEAALPAVAAVDAC